MFKKPISLFSDVPFADVPLLNQRIWDEYPARAKEKALDAIAHGGFYGGRIRDRRGNYEGEIMAIRNGWAVPEKEYSSSYITTEAGWQAMRDDGRQIPKFLPAIDNWHNMPFDYLVYDTTDREKNPALLMMTKVIPARGHTGMDPILTRPQVIALRDYLNEWLERTDRREKSDGE